MRRQLTGLIATVALATASVAAVGTVNPGPAAANPALCPPATSQYAFTPVLDGTGVAVCNVRPASSSTVIGSLIVVDFNAGARFGVVESRTTNLQANTFATAQNKIFEKKTTEEWFNWAAAHPDYKELRYGPQGTPNHSGRLFATWSSSFFIDADNGVALTAVSHMLKNWSSFVAYGADGGAPGTAVPASQAQSWMGIAKSPTGNHAADQSWFYLDTNYPTYGLNPGNTMAALAGFRSTSGPACGSVTNWRHYAGARDTDGDARDDRAYFLHLATDASCQTAVNVMTAAGATRTVQYDGGGSAQMYAKDAFGGIVHNQAKTCIWPISPCRKVPVVFAIYEGPGGT